MTAHGPHVDLEMSAFPPLLTAEAAVVLAPGQQ
jgi:hypothetical protein